MWEKDSGRQEEWMRLNEDPPEEIGTPEAGWDGKARRTQRPQGERAERFELPEPVPGPFSAAAGDREDMPEGENQVVVNQVGSSESIFRSSNTLSFERKADDADAAGNAGGAR